MRREKNYPTDLIKNRDNRLFLRISPISKIRVEIVIKHCIENRTDEWLISTSRWHNSSKRRLPIHLRTSSPCRHLLNCSCHLATVKFSQPFLSNDIILTRIVMSHTNCREKSFLGNKLLFFSKLGIIRHVIFRGKNWDFAGPCLWHGLVIVVAIKMGGGKKKNSAHGGENVWKWKVFEQAAGSSFVQLPFHYTVEEDKENLEQRTFSHLLSISKKPLWWNKNERRKWEMLGAKNNRVEVDLASQNWTLGYPVNIFFWPALHHLTFDFQVKTKQTKRIKTFRFTFKTYKLHANT